MKSGNQPGTGGVGRVVCGDDLKGRGGEEKESGKRKLKSGNQRGAGGAGRVVCGGDLKG